MRNQEGIYRRIMQNANRPELDVSLAYCVSTLNEHCVEKVLEEWRGVGIKGILFSFYTPIESIKDPLFMGMERRDEIIRKLIRLKETRYGDYILNEPRVLELMLSENSRRVTDHCVFASKGISLDPMGKKKPKCMLGEKADCDRCGCIVPFHLAWRSEKRKILNEVYTDLSAYLSGRTRALFGREAGA
jgi:hypothetical protein